MCHKHAHRRIPYTVVVGHEKIHKGFHTGWDPLSTDWNMSLEVRNSGETEPRVSCPCRLTSHQATPRGRSSRWRWSTAGSGWWRCLAWASPSSSAGILKQRDTGTALAFSSELSHNTELQLEMIWESTNSQWASKNNCKKSTHTHTHFPDIKIHSNCLNLSEPEWKFMCDIINSCCYCIINERRPMFLDLKIGHNIL